MGAAVEGLQRWREDEVTQGEMAAQGNLLPLLKKLMSLLCFMADCGVVDLPANTIFVTAEHWQAERHNHHLVSSPRPWPCTNSSHGQHTIVQGRR